MTDAPKKRVLIVDDDALLCEQLGNIIQYFGYDAVLAADGSEALSQFKKQPVDLVLADNHMPGISGIELMHEFHRLKSDLPVIILTGYPSEETIVQTLLEGGYTYLAKPVNLDRLRALIKRALGEA